MFFWVAPCAKPSLSAVCLLKKKTSTQQQEAIRAEGMDIVLTAEYK